MKPEQKPHGAGRSSYGFVNRSAVFDALSLSPTTVFLDIGSGRGDYALAAAERVGSGGRVYAVDAWEEGLSELRQRAKDRGFTNVETIPADVNNGIPLETGSVDVALLATVLHDLLRNSSGDVAVSELARVLRPGGRLAVIEFKKSEDGPGPPPEVRMSPEDVEGTLASFGFKMEALSEVSPYHYLFMARRADE